MFYHIYKKIINFCGIFIYSIFLIFKCCNSIRPLCCGDTYIGRVCTLFDARMRNLRPSVSLCTLLNCVTINMIYRPTLLQEIYILSQICLFFKIILLPCLYIDLGYTAMLSYTIVSPTLLLHPLTLLYFHHSISENEGITFTGTPHPSGLPTVSTVSSPLLSWASTLHRGGLVTCRRM